MAGYLVDCEPLRQAGYDPSTIAAVEQRNQQFERFLADLHAGLYTARLDELD